jgi:isopentenyl-diphosphate Delta-isomerase
MQNKQAIIAVNDQDQVVGTVDKLTAHQQNICHRAFSVLLFRQTDQGVETLLQQREASKYHSPEKWSNACCSHPRPNKIIADEAHIRLQFEMNISTPLTPIGKFYYQTPCDNDLYEHEWDYVFYGTYSQQTCAYNPQEVQDIRWVNYTWLVNDLKKNPNNYTPWLQELLNFCNHPRQKQKLFNNL